MIALIAAVGGNGVIGADGRLPWRLSSDLKRFKALTMGKTIVMGRKTFQSIGAPLPGRRSVVVTRDGAWTRPGVDIAHDIDAALALAGAEAMIIGGAQIYAQTIARADRLYITEVDAAPAGDAHFPPIDPARWRAASRIAGERGPHDEAGFVFVDYVRV